MVNAPVSYSGRPGFKSRSPRPAILIVRFFVVFSAPSDEYRDSALKSGQTDSYHILFQFIIINLSPYHRNYIV
jgi:hypothetical protein